MRILSKEYTVLETSFETMDGIFYKALAKKDRSDVLVKTSKERTQQSHAEIIHEYHMTKDLISNGILTPRKLEKSGGVPFFIMEQFQGITLTKYLTTKPTDIQFFLKIAINLATVLATLQNHRIIHKFIHPTNILIHPQTEQIVLTGFSQSTKLTTESEHQHVNPLEFKEQISYFSPEQTGRMNRSVDHRSDLYSAGILFFKMITGQLPYKETDAMGVVHAHLAVTPQAPNKINPTIPKVVSDLIMKLLEKMPENRYQSAHGLLKDLERCFTQLKAEGTISPFPLGERDVSPFLEKTNKLYGREKQMNQLLAGFESIQHGGNELYLIPGSAGIGKTRLVNELNRPLSQKRGYFIAGKCLNLDKHTPYLPFIQAFQSLIKQIMMESPSILDKLREELQERLASNAKLFSEFVPEIEWLIGKQNEGATVNQEAHHNFMLAVRTFLNVITRENQPIILFIDDLQWADHATLDLIEYLIKSQDTNHLLLVGAYRNEEIDVSHTFKLFMDKVREKYQVNWLELDPLPPAVISQWISETLLIGSVEEHKLIDFLYRLSKGNPFYVTQLLQSLYEEEIIQFDFTKATWIVRLDRLKNISISESIVDFMSHRVDRLSEQVKEVMQLAASIGNEFDLKTISTIRGEDYATIAKLLWDSLEEGYIFPVDTRYKWVYPNENVSLLDKNPPTYRFVHDKIQHAFYASLTREERKRNHLKIAEYLLTYYTERELEEDVFKVVNHLNLCESLLDDELRLKLVKWNWLAGTKAKQAAAFESALIFFSIGKKLLPENSWLHHYDLTFKTLIGLGEAQYLNHLFDEAEATFEELHSYATSNLDRISIYNLKIILNTHIHQVEKAHDSGLSGLSIYGWKFKKDPGKFMVAKEYLLTKLALNAKKSYDLLDLPTVADEELKTVMRTLTNTNASAYHVNQNNATILMLRALRLTLKHGDMDLSALVYNNYALTLSAGFGDYDGSYQFGNLALRHVENTKDPSLQARVYFVYGSFVNHWKNHITHNLDYLERSQKLCIETGNLFLAGANVAFIVMTSFIKGDHLLDVREKIENQISFADQNNYSLASDFIDEMSDWIAVLSDEKTEPTWEFKDFTDDKSAMIIHHTIHLQMAYLYDNEDVAEQLLVKLEPIVDSTLVLVIAPEYYFYHSLWVIRLVIRNKIPRSTARKKIKSNLKKLKKWAEQSAANFEHMYLLVLAESSLLFSGLKKEAPQYYHRAIELAEANGFLQDVAVANSCAGRYYISLGLHETAKAYLTNAYYGFIQWGAVERADALYESYPFFIYKKSMDDKQAQVKQSDFDTNAIFQTATIISGEIVLEDLLTKLMEIVLTNAGAEHAYFIFHQEGNLELVASHHVNGKVELYENPKRLEEILFFSKTVVNYVARSFEPIVLDNASLVGEFIDDPYIKENKSKSILCLPAMYQSKLVGVLYLENNQATHTFTRERIDLLSLITSQTAVSLENAHLYAHLERKVIKRTRLLDEANKNLTEAYQELAASKEKSLDLLSNILHDIRSPIAVSQGYVNAILDGLIQDPEMQKKYLTIVKSRMHSLSRLIQDLFDLAKFDSGVINFSKEAIPIDKLFYHLCKQYELEIEQAGLVYKYHIEELSEYPLVEVDVIRMEQVFTNLVSNAIKYTSSGTIEITLSVNECNEVVLTVKDEGIGIPKDELPHVFDRFYTKGRKQTTGGNGLGLTISKEIIQLHHGDLRVESKEGEGSTFYISLPVFDLELEAGEEDLIFDKEF